MHLNPRLKGDWSGKRVIEQKSCYRCSGEPRSVVKVGIIGLVRRLVSQMNLAFDLCSFGFMIPCGYNGILFLLLGNFCDYIRSRNLGFFCLAQNYQCRDLKVGAS